MLDKPAVLQSGASEVDTLRDRIDRETGVGLSVRVESLEKQVRTVTTIVQRNAVDPYIHSGRVLLLPGIGLDWNCPRPFQILCSI
jgi:hypothetical protein